MRKTAATILWLLLMFGGPPAAAQEPDPRAFEHFDRGAELYFEGEFEDAIEAFERGYAIQAHPILQVNIALAYWRLDNLERAIEAGELAARTGRELGPKIASENDARLHAWELTRIARSTAGAIDAEKRAAVAAAAVEPPVETAGAATAPAEPVFGPLGWAGVGTGAIGAALLIGWSVVEVGLGRDVDELEDAGARGDRAAFESAQADLERKQAVARVLLGGGAGLLAVGVGLVAFDLFRPRSESHLSIELVGEGEPGIRWSMRF